MFGIKEFTEDEIKAFILSQMETQETIQWAIIIGIILAVAAAVGVILWYFLHPNSPRQKRLREMEDEETKKKRREEQLQKKIAKKLKELNYTCKLCKAPGLTGPKCEYCQHINFTLEEL
ncbi:MAG: hypothetical protein ACTSRG_00985 [Candidatus Helarchaeota archaeon]